MTRREKYGGAFFVLSQGDFASATPNPKSALTADPAYFDARLALGMALYRKGDFMAAIAEGHKAEQLRPKEQLVHTNLSLFYMKSGDKVTAEKHGLQAKIESWREDAAQAKSPDAKAESNPELVI